MEKKLLVLTILFILLIDNTGYVLGQLDPSEELAILEDTLKSLSRQLMLQQFYTEERIRSEGGSGIKQVRLHTSGSKNYYQESFVSQSFARGRAATIHNHANNQRTVGMGEFVAVMNGVEFRTRHNDYRLYMPHPTNGTLHMTDEVPFPPTPEEVKSKATIEEKITEMREFFKAFKEQNTTHRDYRPYFKPILCYMEGAWTVPKDKIDEPFFSDRHFLDAKNWFDLMDKIRYTSYTGTKSHLENLAFLPATIIGLADDNSPIFAQWNYRILCHPLEHDLPLSRLSLVEDLKSRMPLRRNIHVHERSREARFQISPVDLDEFEDQPMKYQLIDDLMAEIPGKDNYQGILTDSCYDPLDVNTGQPLDVSRYHRWYKSGSKVLHRGFSDDNLFAAMTTQQEVASLQGAGPCVNKKWSYAIPLEIIYLTPLYDWNPYDIEYKGSAYTEYGKTVVADGRNGSCVPGYEFDGTNSKTFYITPAAFYTKGETAPNPADTTMELSCVLDRQGNTRETKASGTRIYLPDIQDIGVIRLRYPIFPAHGEGSAVWKELNAVRDMTMDPEALEKLTGFKALETEIILKMKESREDGHTHYVVLDELEVEKAKLKRMKILKKTTVTNGHYHTLEVAWARWKPPHIWLYSTCDGQAICSISGKHYRPMFEVDAIPE